MFTELDDVLDKLKRGPSELARPAIGTTDASGDGSDVSSRGKKVVSKTTYPMRNAWAFSELARLFVTRPRDPVAKPSPFFQLLRRDVLVLTHGSLEILRHYQIAKQFAMDQRLRLETPGWRVLNFSGNPMPDEKIERERARSMRTPHVGHD